MKTALAMVIAYGISLWMDWDKPHWAGFAIAAISLSTFGQSLNKGAMRLLGTLVAAAVALTLIALFPQNRWGFLVALMLYLGFCTYMMAGPGKQYFWYVCGFVAVIICMAAGPDADAAFETAILRAEQTGLGIVVYSLVAALVWPTNSQAELMATARALIANQRQLFQEFHELLKGRGNAEAVRPLRSEQVELQARMRHLLIAAETDSYHIWELRHLWRRSRRLGADVAITLERWQQSFAEIEPLDLESVLPDLDAFCAELDLRFAQILRLLDGQVPDQLPSPVTLRINDQAISDLPHFRKAALVVMVSHLRRLEEQTRALADTVLDVQGLGEPVETGASQTAGPAVGTIDIDRLAAAFQLMVTFALAYLAWIYVEGIPGGANLVSIAAAIGMSLATMPQVPVSLLFLPTALSVVFATLLYVFVMPQLTGFGGLASMIFAASFAICFLFSSPRQALGKVFGLVMLVTIISVEPQQTYNFLTAATTALMFPVVFVILAITAHIPFSPQPERALQRLLTRFFETASSVLSVQRWDSAGNDLPIDRKRIAQRVTEIESLPRKLAIWSKAIDTGRLRDTSPDALQDLVTSIDALSHRLGEFVAARNRPQAQHLVRDLYGDMTIWREKVVDGLNALTDDPSAGAGHDFRALLERRLAQLEGRIQEVVNDTQGGSISASQNEDFYRLLGAYRGLSEAIIAVTEQSERIDWARLREAHF